MHHHPSPTSPPWIESFVSNPALVHIASTFELDLSFRYLRSSRGPLVKHLNRMLFLAEDCAQLLRDIEEFLLKKNVRMKHYKKAHLVALILKFQATIQELLRSLSSAQIPHWVTKESIALLEYWCERHPEYVQALVDYDFTIELNLGNLDGMLLSTSSSCATESGIHGIQVGSNFLECFSLRQQDLHHLRPESDATGVPSLIQNTLRVGDVHTPTNPQAHSAQRTMQPGTVLFTSVPRQIPSDRIQPLPDESQLIKRGGNGIYADTVKGMSVAVKKIHYRSKEFAILTKIHHPNIMPTLAVILGHENPTSRRRFYCYHVMPRLTGDCARMLTDKEEFTMRNLRQTHRENPLYLGRMQSNFKYITKETLKGLSYLHRLHIAHRDIKGSNILLKFFCSCNNPLDCSCESKLQVVIMDYDAAVELVQDDWLQPSSSSSHASSTTRTQYHCVPIGTNGYRAPECASVTNSPNCSSQLVSTKCDTWSLGLLAYRMLLSCEESCRQRGMAILILIMRCHDHLMLGVSHFNIAPFANCIPEIVIKFASLVVGVNFPHILQDCGQLQVEDAARHRVSAVHHRTHVFSGVGEESFRPLTSSSKAFQLDVKQSVLNSREKQVFNSIIPCFNNTQEFQTVTSYYGTVGAGVGMSKFNQSFRVEDHRNWKSHDSLRTDSTNDLKAGNHVTARVEPDGNDKHPICDSTHLSNPLSEFYNSPVDGTRRLKTQLSVSHNSCVSDGTAAVLATGVTKYDRSTSKEDHPKWVSQAQGNLHQVDGNDSGASSGQEMLASNSSFSNALFACVAHTGEKSGGKPLNTQLSTSEDGCVSQGTAALESDDFHTECPFTGVAVSKYNGSNRKEDHPKWASCNANPRADSSQCDFEVDDKLSSCHSERDVMWPPTSSDETGVVGPLQTQLSFLQDSCVLQSTAVDTFGSLCLFRGGVKPSRTEESGKDDPRDSEAEEEESNEESETDSDETVKTKETTKDTGYHTMPQANLSGSELEPADGEPEGKSLTLSPFDHRDVFSGNDQYQRTPQEEEEYPRSQELVFVRSRTWDIPRDIFPSPIEETEGVTDAEHCPTFVPSFTPHHNVSSFNDESISVFILENGSVASPVTSDSGSGQVTNSVETLESSVEHDHELNSTPCLNEVPDVKPFYSLGGT